MVRPIHDVLAPELLSLILALLDRHDLARTSLVPRSFRALSSRFLYASLVFKGACTNPVDLDYDFNPIERGGEERKARREQLLSALTPVGEYTTLGTPGRSNATYWQSDVEPSAWIRSIHVIDCLDLKEQWHDLARLVKTATALKQVIMKSEATLDDYPSVGMGSEPADVSSFWTELQRSESLNALTLIMGPSIPLGLDQFRNLTHLSIQFRNLTHLSIKSYEIDTVDDGSLPFTLTHLFLEYVDDINTSFLPPALFANLCSLSLKNVPSVVFVTVTDAIKTFSSQAPRPTSSLRKLRLDPFPHGFACLRDRTWVPNLLPLFLALSSPTYSSLVDLEILSTPSSSRDYILDARALLQALTEWFPRLERLVFNIGAGDVLIDAHDGIAPPTQTTSCAANYTLWLGSFSEFKALRSLTHNLLLETPAAIRTACHETFTLIRTLDTLSIRTGTKKAFDFSRMVPNEDGAQEEREGGCKVKTVIHYGSLGMTESEARRRWPEGKLRW